MTTLSAAGSFAIIHYAKTDAYSVQMRNDFAAVRSTVADDPDARAVLIAGPGRRFAPA